MVTVASRLLLLAALLLSGIQNAVSKEDYKSRGLAIERPLVSPFVSGSNGSEDGSSFKVRTGKSGKGVTSVTGNKSGKKSAKTGKSDGGKGAKALHVGGDLTVEYTVVEHFEGKSSKSKSSIPDFEYIEISNKSSNDEEDSTSEGGKNAKYDKPSDGGTGKNMKSSEGSNGKYTKSSEEVGKESKSSDGSEGSGAVTNTKTSKSTKGAPYMAPPLTSATSPPTEEGTFGVGVPIYSLLYKLTSKNEPTAEELIALKEATSSYLDDFFVNEFDEDDFTIYSQFITDIDGVTESENMKIVVSYDSIVRFGQLSLIKPMPEQLGSAIEEAFTGLNMIQYENWLTRMLPQDNIFVGSKCQYFNGDGVSGARLGVAGIAASAAAMALLVAGVVLYKSKNNDRENDIDMLKKSPGDITVAGETFAGETYDSVGSVSEEEGTKKDNVGSIPVTDDSDSLKPVRNNVVGDSRGIFRLAPRNFFSGFKSSTKSTPRTSSFEDVALQAPAYGDRFQDNIMSDPSSSEDDESQMSDSELSQFVANQTSGSHTLEIKSILSQDSIDDNATGDLSVRDNSSRRLRTVAEIEALLSSELKDEHSNSGSRSSRSIGLSRPRTVEEIESLLSADDDDSIVELSISDEDRTIEEC